MADKVLGRWALIPELSIYQQGSAPLSGVYEIARRKEQFEFRVRWTPVDGGAQEIAFAGSASGEKTDVGGGLAMAVVVVSDSILDTTAYLGDRRVGYARRAASEDGALLSVMQEAFADDGAAIRNFQVYRRMA